MLLATVGWPDVAMALIAGIPGIIAAVAAMHVRKQIKTPSKTSIGKQTESLHHVALGNNYRLQQLTGELAADEPPEATEEELQVNPPNGDKFKKVTPPNG